MAQLDTLRRKRDSLEARSADFVDRSSLGGLGEPGTEGYLARGGLAHSCLENVPEVDFFDEGGGDVRGGEGAFDGDDSEIDGAQALEGTWRRSMRMIKEFGRGRELRREGKRGTSEFSISR